MKARLDRLERRRQAPGVAMSPEEYVEVWIDAARAQFFTAAQTRARENAKTLPGRQPPSAAELRDFLGLVTPAVRESFWWKLLARDLDHPGSAAATVAAIRLALLRFKRRLDEEQAE